jgi:hypothetical protein
MTPGVYALLVLAAVDPHEATVIAQVMLQSVPVLIQSVSSAVSATCARVSPFAVT